MRAALKLPASPTSPIIEDSWLSAMQRLFLGQDTLSVEEFRNDVALERIYWKRRNFYTLDKCPGRPQGACAPYSEKCSL